MATRIPMRAREPVPRPAVYKAYWHFAAERQRIFELRQTGAPGPWSADPILTKHRFCNAFRASDRVSQYLVREVLYGADSPDEAEDVLARVVLFRLFSRPATWELLERRLGPITAETLSSPLAGEVLDEAFAARETLYTAAFILCANNAYGHSRKHRNHLALVAHMLNSGLPSRIARATSLAGVYDALLEYPLIGPFMAYQLATDLNYSELTDFDEDDFTVPGPGAIRGINKCFSELGGLKPAEVISWVTENQERESNRSGMPSPTLFGRRLHAIDCQNLFCELDKYARVAFPDLRTDRTRIKQIFRPDPTPLALFYPPKWGINEGVVDRRLLELPT